MEDTKAFDDGILALLHLRATLFEARAQGPGQVSQILGKLSESNATHASEGKNIRLAAIEQRSDIDEGSEDWHSAVLLQVAYRARLARRALREGIAMLQQNLQASLTLAVENSQPTNRCVFPAGDQTRFGLTWGLDADQL